MTDKQRIRAMLLRMRAGAIQAVDEHMSNLHIDNNHEWLRFMAGRRSAVENALEWIDTELGEEARDDKDD